MLLSGLLLLTLGVIQVDSPATAYRAALDDLKANVPPSEYPYTRYLALWTVDEVERPEMAQSVVYWVNGLHWRKAIIGMRTQESGKYAPLELVARGQLIRFNLRYFDWDKYSRQRQLERFQKLGVSYSFKDEAEKQKFLDVWELLVAKEPYFRVNRQVGNTIVRGWLDPAVEYEARHLTFSRTFCIRADWFLTRVGFDRPKGFYSDFLMLPGTEQDLYKIVGANEEFILQAESVQGGILFRSDVALHNRGVELIKTQTGRDVSFLYRTLDTIENTGKRSATKNLLGTIQFDGREDIFTLPNGLHGYMLFNADRKQVGEVPTNIAQRKGHPEDVVVYNAWTCVSCHDQGMNKFIDVAKNLATRKGVALAGIVEGPDYKKNKIRAEELERKIDDYYGLSNLSDFNNLIELHQVSYNLSIRMTNGLSGAENSTSFISWIERYTYEHLTIDQAALEMGFSVPEAITLCKKSDNDSLLALAGGESIPRDAFEDAFHYALQSHNFSWDRE